MARIAAMENEDLTLFPSSRACTDRSVEGVLGAVPRTMLGALARDHVRAARKPPGACGSAWPGLSADADPAKGKWHITRWYSICTHKNCRLKIFVKTYFYA